MTTSADSPGVLGSRVSDCSGPKLFVVPVSRTEANAYVKRFHRHNSGLPADKFAVAVADGGGVVHGVAIAGIPKARMLNDGVTLEVSRVCTLGTPNACSALYGACARVAKAMGYRRVVTYTLVSEAGASLRAAGFTVVAAVKGESWKRRNTHRDPAYADQHDTGDKQRWEIRWNGPMLDLIWPDELASDQAVLDFGEAS